LAARGHVISYITFVSLSILLDQRVRYSAADLTLHTLKTLKSDGRQSDGKILSEFPYVPMYLPIIDLKDTKLYESKRSGFAELRVSIHEIPANGRTTDQEESYFFVFRARADLGDTRITVPQLGLASCRMSLDHCLLVPPHAPVRVEWTNAAGQLAKFCFFPRFFKSMARQSGCFPESFIKRLDGFFFSFDQRLEDLCQLLMEETETGCQLGPLYFEALARAVAMGVLNRVHYQACAERHAASVNPSIRRSVELLEECFAHKICIGELAARAGLSPRHFARSFLEATGCTPHDYLLRLRLSCARELMTRPSQAVCLKEIAKSCGFYDQTHFGRHFRRVFGTTPASFLRAQERPLTVTKPSCVNRFEGLAES
jgi:AraC-like DNA-binding protein